MIIKEIASFQRGDQGTLFGEPHVVEVYQPDAELYPLIPASLDLPGFSGPLVPVAVTYRRGIDTGMQHGPFQSELNPRKEDEDVFTGQHDIFFDDEHVAGDAEEPHIEGEEGSSGRSASPYDRHLVFSSTLSFRPTSDWKPR
jgi:hypothetical protein